MFAEPSFNQFIMFQLWASKLFDIEIGRDGANHKHI